MPACASKRDVLELATIWYVCFEMDEKKHVWPDDILSKFSQHSMVHKFSSGVKGVQQ